MSRALPLVLVFALGWVAARLVIPPPAVGYVSPRVLLPGPAKVRVPMLVNARWAVQGDNGAHCNPATGQWVPRQVWSAGPAEIVCAPARGGIRLLIQGPAKDSRVVDPSISYVEAKP
jgi:hypothetical protein